MAGEFGQVAAIDCAVAVEVALGRCRAAGDAEILLEDDQVAQADAAVAVQVARMVGLLPPGERLVRWK